MTDLTPFHAQMRRYFWLYSMGALSLGSLTTFLVWLVIRAMQQARLDALQVSVIEYETLLDAEHYSLPPEVATWAQKMTDTVLSDLPPVEPLTDEELDLTGDELIDVAQSVPDDDLADDDEWLEHLTESYDERLAETRERLERELLGDRANLEARIAQDVSQLEEETKTLADTSKADERSQRRFERRIERLEADLAAQAEQDRLADEERQEQKRQAAQEWQEKVIERHKYVAKYMESITREHVADEYQAAKLEGAEQVLEDGSPVLPEGEVSIVWETDEDPCPYCAALRGSAVRKTRKGKVRTHHPNCQCFPDVQPPVKGVPGFQALTIEQLRHQLEVLEPLKESAWKERQTRRLLERIKELEA